MGIDIFAPERRSSLAFSLGALAVAALSGWIFISMHEAEPIIPGPGVTRSAMLSSMDEALKGTRGDTPIFELKGERPGGTIMVLGGTHPPEISGMMAAILIIENVKVTEGRIIVVPQANRSGFTYTEPMEAFLHSFTIDTPGGQRWFRVGMRLTNPADQWPDPDAYVHTPSGEQMIGHEVRNLNRNHPGRAGHWQTAEVSNALTGLAKQSSIVFDTHEGYPEYPVLNSMIAHENAFETAAIATATMAGAGVKISLSASPKNLHGLSHREFGDFVNTQAVLTETVNPSMGRFRGRLSRELLVDGIEPNYVAAAKLNNVVGRFIFTTFDEKGWPLNLRVARQLLAIQEVINAYNELNPKTPIVVEKWPTYKDVVAKGLGAFLNPPPKA